MKINERVPAAKKLQGWMNLKGLNVPGVAAHFDVSRQAVYRWFAGKPPEWTKMIAILDETGIQLDDWVER